MKRRKLLAAGAAIVAIAIAFWWWHRGAPAPKSQSGGDRGGAMARPNDRGQANGDPIAAMAPMTDDDPRGALRLEGQVLGPDDHPVAGATVVLVATPPRSVTTEADGGFAFDALVGRAYVVLARTQHAIAGPVTVRLTATSEPVVLRLRPAASLTVTVIGSDAKPVDGATVELRGVDLQSEVAHAGIAKFTAVVPGFYDVVASAPGMAHAYQQTRIAGQATLRIVLAVGAPVSGRVVDDEGAPVEGARVVFAASGEFRRQADPRLDAAVTGPGGVFRFEALPVGSFRFVASHPDHAPGTSALVMLDGRTEKSDVVVKLAPGATARGRVVDTSKQPVVGARIRIAAGGGRGRRGGGGPPGGPGGFGGGGAPRQAYSDAQGEFELKGLPRGELYATASHELGSSSGVAIDTSGGDVKDVVITLDLTAVIAGTVTDPDGLPIEGAQVTAIQRPGAGGFDPTQVRNRGPQSETSDANGKFKITGLALGSYTMRASRSATRGAGFGGFGRRGRRGSDGVDAEAGDQNVKIVLPPEGAVIGKIIFTDGTTPPMFSVAVGGSQQSFIAGNAFELDAIAPGDYTLTISGPTFDTKAQDLLIEAGKTADVGTITVAQGRKIAGTVIWNGQPIANATVYAGSQVMGTGASNDSPGARFGLANNTKQDTSAGDGSFAMAGFGDGDLTVIADLPGTGRSTPLRVTEDMPGQSSLVLELQQYGSISGTLTQGGAPAQGTAVTAQSTTTPGAVYVIAAGADGTFSFDFLAPDTYKVSAMLGSPRRGMHFYSQQVVLPPAQNITVNLTVDPGSITVVVTPVASQGALGMAIAYLVNGSIMPTSANDLSLKLAAAGPGDSQVVAARPTQPATFTSVAPASYTACVVALPLAVTGNTAQSYLQQHGTKLPVVCKQLDVAATPATQALQLTVDVPAMISGSGTGSSGGSPQ